MKRVDNGKRYLFERWNQTVFRSIGLDVHTIARESYIFHHFTPVFLFLRVGKNLKTLYGVRHGIKCKVSQKKVS